MTSISGSTLLEQISPAEYDFLCMPLSATASKIGYLMANIKENLTAEESGQKLEALIDQFDFLLENPLHRNLKQKVGEEAYEAAVRLVRFDRGLAAIELASAGLSERLASVVEKGIAPFHQQIARDKAKAKGHLRCKKILVSLPLKESAADVLSMPLHATASKIAYALNNPENCRSAAGAMGVTDLLEQLDALLEKGSGPLARLDRGLAAVEIASAGLPGYLERLLYQGIPPFYQKKALAKAIESAQCRCLKVLAYFQVNQDHLEQENLRRIWNPEK